MPRLEGTLTLVNTYGPWFKIQGRHLARPGVRVSLSPQSGVTIDIAVGRALWVTVGWYPRHVACKPGHLPSNGFPALLHACWAKRLRDRVITLPASS